MLIQHPFFLLFGLIIAVFGVFMAIDSLKFSKDVVRVEATVIEHEEVGSTGKYAPVVRFFVNGHQYEFGGGWGSSYPPNVGTKMSVVYRTGRPEEAQFDSWSKVIGGIFLVVLGSLIVWFQGIRHLFPGRRPRR
jgi:hypothetical protein